MKIARTRLLKDKPQALPFKYNQLDMINQTSTWLMQWIKHFDNNVK